MHKTGELDEGEVVTSTTRWRAILVRLAAVIWIGILAWALYGLHKEWSGFHLRDLNEALARVGWKQLSIAVAFSVIAYVCNTFISMLSQVWLRVPLQGIFRSMVKYFISTAFTINAGGSLLGGGSIRLRLASAQGMTAEQVGRATVFTAIAGWAGCILLCALIFLCFPVPLPWISPILSKWLAAPLLVTVLVSPFLVRWYPRIFPPLGISYMAYLASAADWLFAGLALWALLPSSLAVNPLVCVGMVMIAQTVSSASHVPGGVGVLEFTLTKVFIGLVTAPILAGAVIIYRLVFYLLPFLSSIILLGYFELRLRSPLLAAQGAKVARGWSVVAPRLAMILTVGGGFMLLLSANTPIEANRRGLVSLLPLAFVELSHFISSLAGAFLIVLGRGLQRKIRSAWWLAVCAMSGSMVFSIAKGFDWEEALVLCFLLLCLLSSKQYFYRQAALWQYRFTCTWWLLLVSLLAVSLWVGFFTARHVDYQSELWWRFALDGDASRFLRAAMGASCVFLIVGLTQALRPTKKRSAERNYDEEKVRILVEQSPSSEAALAYLSDKSFVYSLNGSAGLMYADQGRSRVVMGDPLGDADEASDLLWSFIEQANDEGMRTVFYQVSVGEMPRLVDMGFKLFKLGEEAKVDLVAFQWDGPESKKLRQAKSRFQKLGLSLQIWTKEQAMENFMVLQEVSDQWVATHRAGEKRFSLGCFERDYISHFSIAVVKDLEGRVIAFSNLLETATKSEISVDLMRHVPEAPNGVMEAMFVELILWGKSQGYQNFNLGMAPLSGLSSHAIAPLWHKLAVKIFRNGESFYNFQGLRSFKEKFRPRWYPRYMAVPSAWSLPSALLDVTVLIGGGMKNTFGKK